MLIFFRVILALSIISVKLQASTRARKMFWGNGSNPGTVETNRLNGSIAGTTVYVVFESGSKQETVSDERVTVNRDRATGGHHRGS